MGDIRVYEAARKLNIETKELMRLLGERGKPVKSPIAFITQADMDDILNYLTSSGGKEAPEESGEAEEVSAEGGTGGASIAEEVEERKISLVKEESEEPAREAAGRVIQMPAPAAVKEAETGEEAEEPEEAEKAPAASVEGQPMMATSSPQPQKAQTILSFLAIAVASAAMLLVLVLNSSITKNTEGITRAMETAAALQTKTAALDDGVSINKGAIEEQGAAITDLRGRIDAAGRAQARADLLRRSEALDSLSVTARGGAAARLERLAQELRQLASSL